MEVLNFKLSLNNDNMPDAFVAKAPRSPATYRSFIRSDFVTIPVTSPLCVTSTAL